MTPKVRAASAATAVTCPAGSSGAARSGDRGARASSATAISPAGRLRKKIARQLNPDVSAPPATGPPAMATVPPTAHTAMAFARRTGLPYTCRTSASEAGSMTAAALPWTARPTIRNPSVGARPHAADDARKAARPMAYRRLAPTRSEIAPAEISRAANISVYASITHCRPAVDPPSVCSIPGRATFTAVESRLSMKNPSSAASRTITPRLADRCPVLPSPSRAPVTAAARTAATGPAPSTLIGPL